MNHNNGLSGIHICFYGAGSMAEAIARGIVERKLVQPEQVSMLNRGNAERLIELHERYGVRTVLQGGSAEAYLAEADIVFLAMKPKDAAAALAALKPSLSPGQLVISVIAGLSIGAMEKLLGVRPIVRTMPNTSSTIGLGVTGITYSASVTAEQRAVTEALFSAIGINAVVEEPLQLAVNAISGSGPAYIYYVMEAMLQAAGELGMERGAARELVVQTVLGAAEMVRSTGEEPEELRRKVTSPNGTTQAAIETMAEGGLQPVFVQAIRRCAERAAEIGADIERSIS